MKLEINSALTQNQKRSLENFFSRAYDSDSYAVYASRVKRGAIYSIVDKADGYDSVNEANKLAKRAMVAIGRTFDYRIER